MLNFRNQKNTEKAVAAILYPWGILIVAKSKKGDYMWVYTLNYSKLENSISDQQLGEEVIKYLNKSISEDNLTQEEMARRWKLLLKQLKCKTEKSFYQDARCVTILSKGKELEFKPYKTSLKEKTFRGNPPAYSGFIPIPDHAVLGAELRRNWNLCLYE